MGLKKSTTMSGKDRYRLIYQTELEKQVEWLKRGAAYKVNSIETLIKRNNIKSNSIIEVGCGTGAVILECQRRGLANRYFAVEYAQEAVRYLLGHSEGIEVLQADITDPRFSIDDFFDVVILSHVLEHLDDPPAFLFSLKISLHFSHIIIEVPLEDLLICRLKNRFHDRKANKAGHVQFFTIPSFEGLISLNGLKILDRRTYFPILDLDTINFLCEKDQLPSYRKVIKLFTDHWLPKLFEPLWVRFVGGHHAVLCIVEDQRSL